MFYRVSNGGSLAYTNFAIWWGSSGALTNKSFTAPQDGIIVVTIMNAYDRVHSFTISKNSGEGSISGITAYAGESNNAFAMDRVITGVTKGSTFTIYSDVPQRSEAMIWVKEFYI